MSGGTAANSASLKLTEEELEVLNKRLLDKIEQDGRVFVTGTKIRGRIVLRSCFANHRTQKRHLHYILDVLQELLKKLVTEMAQKQTTS